MLVRGAWEAITEPAAVLRSAYYGQERDGTQGDVGGHHWPRLVRSACGAITGPAAVHLDDHSGDARP